MFFPFRADLEIAPKVEFFGHFLLFFTQSRVIVIFTRAAAESVYENLARDFFAIRTFRFDRENLEIFKVLDFLVSACELSAVPDVVTSDRDG